MSQLVIKSATTVLFSMYINKFRENLVYSQSPTVLHISKLNK